MDTVRRASELRRLAARTGARAAPVVASGVIHALLIAAVLAVGLPVVPRLVPVVHTELVSFEREIPPPPMTAPPQEARRPITTPLKPPPVVIPAKPVEKAVKPPEAPAQLVEAPRPPPKVEERPPKPEEKPPKVEEKPPKPEEKVAKPEDKPAKLEEGKVPETSSAAQRQDPPPATATLRVEEPKALPGAPPQGSAGAVAREGSERASANQPNRAGAPGGSSETPGVGPGTGGAARGGNTPGVASRSGDISGTGSSGITRSAIPSGGYQVQPTYPATARRLGIQGTSLLRVHVAADGRVTEIVVAKSAGHADMDQAASDAVRQWRFEPGRRGNEAVGMWVLLPIEFRIK